MHSVHCGWPAVLPVYGLYSDPVLMHGGCAGTVASSDAWCGTPCTGRSVNLLGVVVPLVLVDSFHPKYRASLGPEALEAEAAALQDLAAALRAADKSS